MSWTLLLLFFAWACLFQIGLTTYIFVVLKRRDHISFKEPFVQAAAKILAIGGQGLFVIAALLTFELYVEGLAELGLKTISGGQVSQYLAVIGLLAYTLYTVPSAFYLRSLEQRRELSKA